VRSPPRATTRTTRFPTSSAGRARTNGEVFERADPSRADAVASRARRAPRELVDEAVAEAAEAQRAWRAVPVAERCRLMRAAADAIRERVMKMAGVVTLETGKPRVESIAEVEEAIDLIETYCRQIEEHDGFAVALGTLSDNERNQSVLRPFASSA
jgi:1-pyrroline-5-carboxylate dehydrogenase